MFYRVFRQAEVKVRYYRNDELRESYLLRLKLTDKSIYFKKKNVVEH